MKKASKDEKKLLLITDLNLTNEEYIQKILPQLKNLNADIKVIDHHALEDETLLERYEWYNLDTSNSATKFFFDILLEENKILININLKNNKASVRSSNDKANLLCRKFGGNGHPNAGGFQYDLSEILSDSEQELLKDREINNSIKEDLHKKIFSFIANKITLNQDKLENNNKTLVIFIFLCYN